MAKKNRVILNIVFIIALVFNLLFYNLSPALAKQTDVFNDIEHSDVDFSDMKYVHYDTTDFYNNLEEINSLCTENGKTTKVTNLYEELLAMLDDIATQYNICQIYYYKDVNSEYYATELEYSYGIYLDTVDDLAQTTKALLNSEYSDVIAEKVGEDMIEEITQYEPLTDEQEELLEKIHQLQQDYNKAITKDYTFIVDGEEYTLQKYYEEADSITREQALKIVNSYYKTVNEETGEIYIELVDSETQYAKTYGYDSYADYAYENIYYRDYDTTQIKAFYDSVKKYIVPLYKELDEDWDYDKIEELYSFSYDKEQLLSLIKDHIGDISSEMEEAFNYMEDYNLYDFDYSDTKSDIGFTVELNSYNEPFIFYSPSGSYYDVKTLIHEFGHYNSAYYNMTHVLCEKLNYDLSEVHSQGLEMLYLYYYDDMFGENADIVRDRLIYDMISSIVEGCMFDEFQVAVYNAPDMTLDEINLLYEDISSEYGIDYTSDNEYLKYIWVDVSHNFESPMYYISYATSAVAAFNIWEKSLDDRDGAIDTYLKLVSSGEGEDYLDVLEECSLNNMLDDNNIKCISETVAEYLGKTPEQKRENIFEAIFSGDNLIIIRIVLVSAALIVMLIILTKILFKNKNNDNENM
ncbi:MAG: hypothetical protein R2876_02435 [Eubacteriales bacterium]